MFSKDTLHLIDLLQKYNTHTKIKDIRKNKYFMDLYKKMQMNLTKIPKDDIQIDVKSFSPKDYLEENDFTSSNITKKILLLQYCYELMHENNKIIFFTKKKMIRIPNIIVHMFQIIQLLKKLFHKSENKQKIIYFETDEKKKFPSSKEKNILGPNEVNSGLTFLNFHNIHKNGDIILYRREEILKVLTHELIHSNLIDSTFILKTDENNQFSHLFCVDYKILLNEAYTESLATLIHLFYIHIWNQYDKNELATMFQNEMKYSIYICNKIMNYYDIHDLNDILKKDDKCIHNFPQKSNVFSYYILKNILLTNHNLLASILSKYTNKYYQMKSKFGISSIIKLIFEKYTIEKIEVKDKNKSLRLTLYEQV
jgi:hypothetical protein